ncbi:hypothetical protein M2171_002570 [Bradyrhizobium japonicum USDA 38]|uniref:hypothetical protein n=1 Tax=Bradyrhizobium japonicum TaxID=375 RepID=UPI00040F72D4|nr:hypothetical protein [Bradyrhizobium japonicum]MCS3893437.1 hypothetical protein [Bradyrhizobium japonicum USDA 38]MCS3945951.1 hypothetical protein [Bradyrhizobium japonicum]
MFKNLISAIGAAIQGVISIVRVMLSVPGRLVGGLLGAGAPPPAEDSPIVADMARRVAEEDAKAQDNWAQIANAIWHWCMDSLLADGPVAVPPSLPRAVREWLPGLSSDEAEKLVSSDKNAIQFHVRLLYAIPGVRRVQRLEPVKDWPPEPVYKDPSPGFVAYATPAPGVRRA